MRTSVIPIPAPVSAAKAAAVRYLSCLRLEEILVLQGSPLLGAAFAIGRPAVEYIGPLAILVVANVFLVAHIFLLNDWANLDEDLADPNKAARVFTARGVSREEVAGFAVVLLAMSLVLLVTADATTAAVVLGTAVVIAAGRGGSRVGTWFGTISYSLYLVHGPLGSRVVNAGMRLPATPAVQAAILALGLVTSIGAAVALLTWSYVSSSIMFFGAQLSAVLHCQHQADASSAKDECS